MKKRLWYMIKHSLYGASMIAASVTAPQAQTAFQSDCNAYVGLEGYFRMQSPGKAFFEINAQPGVNGFASLFIIPNVGNFIIGRELNGRSGMAVAPAPKLQEVLHMISRNGGPNTDDPRVAASWILDQFDCVARDDYLRTSLDTAVADISQQFQASEKRVREALLRGLAGQLSGLKGQIEAIRRETPGLAHADREEILKRLLVLEAQVESSTTEICLAVTQVADQC